MDEQIWFRLKHRDKSYTKYTFEICRVVPKSGSFIVPVDINKGNDYQFSFSIEFSSTLVRSHIGKSDEFSKRLGPGEHSPLIENILREELAKRNLKEFAKEPILINSKSGYAKRIFTNESYVLNINREPLLVAQENKFVRTLVLNELYRIHNNRGPSPINYGSMLFCVGN